MRIGFIGGYGHHYLRGLLNDPAVSPVEVAVAGDAVDPAAAAAWADRLRETHRDHAVAYFEDGTALLDTFKPDLLSVGAVFGHTGDWNAAALARDIRTVTDKPAAATFAQLRRLEDLAAADASRVLLMELDFRARQCFRAARQCVRDGRIGPVVLATAQKSYRFGRRPAWYADRAAYGGLVMWVASHGIDAVEFVTGLTITRAVGHGGNLSQPAYGAMEDHVAVLTELQGGATALVHADFARPQAAATHGDDRLRVAGAGGLIEVRDDRCYLTTADAPERDVTDWAAPLPMHTALLAAASGQSADLFSTAQTLHTSRVLLALRDAVDRRAWVDVAAERVRSPV